MTSPLPLPSLGQYSIGVLQSNTKVLSDKRLSVGSIWISLGVIVPVGSWHKSDDSLTSHVTRDTILSFVLLTSVCYSYPGNPNISPLGCCSDPVQHMWDCQSARNYYSLTRYHAGQPLALTSCSSLVDSSWGIELLLTSICSTLSQYDENKTVRPGQLYFN